MKKIFLIIKNFIFEDFDIRVYAACGLFLIIAIYLNYTYNIEDGIIDYYYGKPERTILYFIFYALAWYITFLIQSILKKELHLFLKKGFWLYTLFGLAILACDSSFSLHAAIGRYVPPDVYLLFYKILGDLNGIFVTGVPLLIFYLVQREPRESFYGLSFKNVSAAHSYLFLLALMLPIVVWASFQPDFLKSYPIYPDTQAHNYLKVPKYLTVLVFEFFYAFDFIIVELLFRGFFIIGLAHILGKSALLPMVTMYAFLHFGKPLGETIGSVFGGYILGIMAFKTKNIWGGVILHIGIALLMELAAFIQKS